MDCLGLIEEKYTLENKPFSGGGEGDIFNIIGLNDKCAKIYHIKSRLPETEAKLKIMVNNLPDSRVLSQIAWPIDILYSMAGEFLGFVMPKINVTDELIAVYEYPPTKYQRLTFEQKLIVAQNICAVIDAVHEAGFVFGDFNPNNIGVDMNTGHVAFWDTDSYHIRDKVNNITYRCKVCLDGYVAPELISKCKVINPQTGKKYNYEDAPLDTFTKETDNFALAIHIFKLFMNGYSPFAGIVANQVLDSTIAPGVGNEAIERDQYCYKPGNIHLSKAVPDKTVFPKEIISLFDRAFIDGRINPTIRPTAKEWYHEIEKFSTKLKQCKLNPVHQYMRGLTNCPWCEIDKKFNVGIQQVKIISNSNTLNYSANSAAILANRNNITSNFSANNTTPHKVIIAELFTITLAIVFVGVFYFVDSYRWKNKLKPEAYSEYDSVVNDWNPYREIEFAGSVSSDNQQDEYTITLNKQGRLTYTYSVDFVTLVSNRQHVDIQVSNKNGGSKSFSSNDTNDLFADGYTVELNSGETYTVKVKLSSGAADYVLKMKKK